MACSCPEQTCTPTGAVVRHSNSDLDVVRSAEMAEASILQDGGSSLDTSCKALLCR